MHNRDIINDCLEQLLHDCPSNVKFNSYNLIDKMEKFKEHRIKGDVHMSMIDLGYAEGSERSNILLLTKFGRKAKQEGGHYAYQENLRALRQAEEKRKEDLLFYQSEIAKGFANQGVLLLTIAEELHKLRKNSKDKKTYKDKVLGFVSNLGIGVSTNEINDFIEKLDF